MAIFSGDAFLYATHCDIMPCKLCSVTDSPLTTKHTITQNSVMNVVMRTWAHHGPELLTFHSVNLFTSALKSLAGLSLFILGRRVTAVKLDVFPAVKFMRYFQPL